MNSPYVVVTAIFFFIFNSCNIKNEKINYTSVNKWIGKKIIIPSDTLSIKLKNTTTYKYSDFFNPDNIKLVVSVNGECGACINKLRAVEEFADEIFLSYDNISLLVYVNSMTTDFVNFEILNDVEINFKYPVVYDYDNKYLKENNFSSNEFYHILLCDKHDKVLMIGDFTKDETLRALYLKEIKLHGNPVIYDYPIIPPIYKSPKKSP